MPSDRTPDPGQVYAFDGRPALYVRTEQRPGGTEPQHLFLVTRNRLAFQHWAADVPDEAELIIDGDGRQQADEMRWLLWAAEHEREILLGLLKQACDWLPRERAAELRQRWRDSQPPADDR